MTTFAFEPKSSQPASAADGGVPAFAHSWLVPVGVTVAGLAAFLLATPNGLGVTPDSTQYMSAAENIVGGEGLVVHWWAEGDVPLTHFPPGLSLALAAFIKLGLTTEGAARLLNGAALAVTLLTVMLLTWRGTRSAGAVAGAGLAVGLERDVQLAHATVWSEPLYVMLSMATLFLIVRAIDQEKSRLLVLAGIVAGVASITRYVGLALIAACILGLFVSGRGLVERLRRVFIFGVVASLPILGLFLRNAMAAGSVANREIGFHPMQLDQLRSVASTIYHWIVPIHQAPSVEAMILALLGAGVSTFVIACRRSGSWRTAIAATRSQPWIPLLLTLYVVAYFAFIVLTITVADAQTAFDARLLVPIVPPVVVTAACILHSIWLDPRSRLATATLVVAVATGATTALLEWIVDARRNGVGYNSREWRSSRLASVVAQLPSNAEIYSNYPDAIYYLSRREIIGIPRMASPTSLRPNRLYDQQMRAVCQATTQRPVYIAYFIRQDPEWFVPSIAEVRRRLASRPRHVAPDGVLDTVPANCRDAHSR